MDNNVLRNFTIPCIFFISIIVCSRQESLQFSYHEIKGPDGAPIWTTSEQVHRFTDPADLNNDGYIDLLAFTHQALEWFEYPEWTKYAIQLGGNWEVGRLHAVDLDADGDLDLVTAKRLEDNSRSVVWFENPLPDGDVHKGAAWIEHLVGVIPPRESNDYVKEYNSADFDRDGKLDIVVGTFANPINTPAELFYFFQNSADDFTMKMVTYEWGHEGLDLGDLDQDGDVDVVVNGRWFETPAAPRTGDYQEHNIDEKWYNQRDNWQRNATDVKVADINGDNRLDVIISHSEKPEYPLSWYSAADPTDVWTEHVIDPKYGWCQTLDAGDIDLDGDIDVLAGRFERDGPPLVGSPQDVRIYLNNGNGSDWTQTRLPDDARSSSPDDAQGGMYDGKLADIDQDGDLDVIGARTYWHGPIYYIRNDLRMGGVK